MRLSTLQIQAMMEMIHTPLATGPTHSQLDDAHGHAKELQEHLHKLEQEHKGRVRELEAEVARAQFKANTMRRVISISIL